MLRPLNFTQVLQAGIRQFASKCPVCGDRVRVTLDPAAYGGIYIHVSCHGSHAYLDLDTTHMATEAALRAAVYLVEGAFVDEARSPDLRELIAYNRA